MARMLNRPLLKETLVTKGLTQSSAAQALGVTRAAVSKWLTGKSFPRPLELLKLGKLLGLGYSQLVETAAPAGEPLIAFRKRASTKTTAEHVAHAKEMGRLLAPVVKHLSFDAFLSPGRLKHPSLEYDYLQALVANLRRELKVDPSGPVNFSDLTGKFKEFQTVIVPVMWGQKSRHENALHIFLPNSKTTWIYLNLDSHLHDFKFWMAHELGHVLAVDLLTADKMDLADDFSDAFAGALLFPEPAAARVYVDYMQARFAPKRLEVIIKAATDYVISPSSVYQEIENYAKARRANLSFEPLAPKTLHAAIARFNKGYPLVSDTLFDGKEPSADQFMRVAAETFKTPIFAALRRYLRENPQSDSTVGRILAVPLADAIALRRALA